MRSGNFDHLPACSHYKGGKLFSLHNSVTVWKCVPVFKPTRAPTSHLQRQHAWMKHIRSTCSLECRTDGWLERLGGGGGRHQWCLFFSFEGICGTEWSLGEVGGGKWVHLLRSAFIPLSSNKSGSGESVWVRHSARRATRRHLAKHGDGSSDWMKASRWMWASRLPSRKDEWQRDGRRCHTTAEVVEPGWDSRQCSWRWCSQSWGRRGGGGAWLCGGRLVGGKGEIKAEFYFLCSFPTVR